MSLCMTQAAAYTFLAAHHMMKNHTCFFFALFLVCAFLKDRRFRNNPG